MIEKVKTFLVAHSITTHSIVAFCVAAVTAYNQVPQFHDYVLVVWAHIPASLKNLAEAGAAVIAWYWRGRAVWTPEQRKVIEAKADEAKAASAGE